MNQSGVVDFLNLPMKKMDPLQILELFTEIIEKYRQTHQNFQTQNISIYKSNVDWDNLLESKN